MPAHRGLKTPELDDLLRQWRFEPSAAARRQLERVEALWSEVFDRVRGVGETDSVFPLEYVLFRATGVRADVTPGPGETDDRSSLRVAAGPALLSDLCILIERLSVRAEITQREVRTAGWLSTSDLSVHWNVSTKTIARYRALGLPARRVLLYDGSAAGIGRGRQSLYFSPAAIDRFARAYGQRLAAAAPFSRVEPGEAVRLYRCARVYRSRLGWSLGKVAERLGYRHGRSPGAVRRAIEALDAAAEQPVFTPRTRLGARGRDELVRAVLTPGSRRTEPGRSGAARAAPGLLGAARSVGVSRATAYRVAAVHRAARLCTLGFADAGRSAEASGDPSESTAADCPSPALIPRALIAPITLDELIDDVAGQPPVAAALERAWATARITSLRSAAAEGARLDLASPNASALDRIETSLRTATRLKALLMWSQFGLGLRTLAGQLARTPREAVGTLSSAALRHGFEQAVRSERGPGLVAGAIDAAIAGIAAGVERFDPGRASTPGVAAAHPTPALGRRLAAPVAVEVNRAVTDFLRAYADLSARAPRAAADLAATLDLPVASAWTKRIDPWQRALDVPDAVADAAVRFTMAGDLPSARRAALGATVLSLHHGLLSASGPWRWPMTLAGTAEALGITRLRAVRAERAFLGWASADMPDSDHRADLPSD